MATESFGRPWDLSPEAAERLLDYLNDDNIPGYFSKHKESLDDALEKFREGEKLSKQFACTCEPS